MTITVLFFAQAREHAGVSSARLELPDGSAVDAALGAIRLAWPALGPLWPHLAVAVDGKLAADADRLRDGAEVALLPPVSGGCR